jgi:GNAT superfamily N-acetyltransferase
VRHGGRDDFHDEAIVACDVVRLDDLGSIGQRRVQWLVLAARVLQPKKCHDAEAQPFGSQPELFAIVAETAEGVVGYATWSQAVSTWRGVYVHMDCLFLCPTARNGGIGASLVAVVQQVARDRGIAEIQWQTPEWNEGAIRFYDRLGGQRAAKQRFVLGA